MIRPELLQLKIIISFYTFTPQSAILSELITRCPKIEYRRTSGYNIAKQLPIRYRLNIQRRMVSPVHCIRDVGNLCRVSNHRNIRRCIPQGIHHIPPGALPQGTYHGRTGNQLPCAVCFLTQNTVRAHQMCIRDRLYCWPA